jgi:hypothetical protein
VSSSSFFFRFFLHLYQNYAPLPSRAVALRAGLCMYPVAKPPQRGQQRIILPGRAD